MDETRYVSDLKPAIDEYLQKHEQFVHWASVLGNQRQGAETWEDSHAHDLATALRNGKILALEAKLINTKGRLKSPKDRQYELNRALEKAGHPIRYCFNLVEKYSCQPGSTDRSEFLKKSQCSLPSELTGNGKNIELNNNSTLENLLKELISTETGGRRGLLDAYLEGVLKDHDQLSTLLILVMYSNHKVITTVTASELVKHLPEISPPDKSLGFPEQIEAVLNQVDALVPIMSNKKDEDTENQIDSEINKWKM